MSKIGADYVGLLVLGVFNAAIGRQNIRSDLVYQPLVRADVTSLHGTDTRGLFSRCSWTLVCYVSCALFASDWQHWLRVLQWTSTEICSACKDGDDVHMAFFLQANAWASQKQPEHVIEEGSEVIFTVHTCGLHLLQSCCRSECIHQISLCMAHFTAYVGNAQLKPGKP